MIKLLCIGVFAAAVVWICLSFLFYQVGSSLLITEDIRALLDRGIRTSGKVERKYPDQKGRIDFSFEVDGREYRGIGSGGEGNPGFNELDAGSKVVIIYDPYDPNTSYMGEPSYYVGSTTRMLRLSSLVAPSFIVLLGVTFYVLVILQRAKRSA